MAIQLETSTLTHTKLFFTELATLRENSGLWSDFYYIDLCAKKWRRVCGVMFSTNHRKSFHHLRIITTNTYHCCYLPKKKKTKLIFFLFSPQWVKIFRIVLYSEVNQLVTHSFPIWTLISFFSSPPLYQKNCRLFCLLFIEKNLHEFRFCV